MTNEQIFDILRPIILSVTGVPECILANPNAPAPDGPYAAVQPQQTLTERGQANIIRTGVAATASQKVEVKAQVICEASVNFYRGDTRTFASKLMQACKRPNVSMALLKAKLGWNRTGPVNNLTALRSDEWESRSQISIFLMYETSDEETINSIERIPWEIQNEKAQVLASGEIVGADAP